MSAYTFIGIGVLGISATLAVGLGSIPADAGYAGITPRFYPTVIASLLAFLGASLIWQEFQKKRQAKANDNKHAESADDGQQASLDWSSAVWVIAGLLLSALLIQKIGFVVSSTLLFVLTARAFGSRQWLRNALVAVVICLPIYWLFTKVLNVSLPSLINSWI